MRKKPKFRRTVIKCPIFHVEWLVQRGGTEQSAFDWYVKRTKSQPHQLEDKAHRGSFTYKQHHRDSVIWFEWTAGAGTISHEIFHAAVRLSVLIDTPINDDNDEVFAHYTGWLTRNIVEKLYA